jgi:NADPH2:quinone reductase
MSGQIELPKSGFQIQSTLGIDGVLAIELADVALTPPEDRQVVVRVEASPINPSDLIPAGQS